VVVAVLVSKTCNLAGEYALKLDVSIGQIDAAQAVYVF
jgi:hypothetical protein